MSVEVRHQNALVHDKYLNLLTDEVIETEECPSKFPVVFHNNPYTGSDTSINQL